MTSEADTQAQQLPTESDLVAELRRLVRTEAELDREHAVSLRLIAQTKAEAAEALHAEYRWSRRRLVGEMGMGREATRVFLRDAWTQKPHPQPTTKQEEI